MQTIISTKPPDQPGQCNFLLSMCFITLDIRIELVNQIYLALYSNL